MSITSQFPLPWSPGPYGFDIKASNSLHVDEICSAGNEEGDKELAALICRAVNNHDALVNALRNARNYIDAVIVNAPDKKKRRNYAVCLRIIDAALEPVGGAKFEEGAA